jgi:hypothetical protein
MKTLIFGRGLFVPTISSKKQIAIRYYRPEAHNFGKNEIFVGEFGDGVDLVLLTTAETEVKEFSELTDEEAQEDGYVNTKVLFKALKEFYPILREDSMMAVIRYQIPTVQGQIPTVSLNEHWPQSQGVVH